ncbi:MAG: AMP-binding protein [Gammaproteobacteria bacterium]|nr:AMP-binding protein [Gammaproteobacteria bacterium]
MNDRSETLQDLIIRAEQTFPDKKAFTCLGASITFSELYIDARDFAHYCQSKLNLVKGDRLAIMLPNILQYPIVVFGAVLAGLTIVNINPLDKAPSIAHELKDSGARVIVVLENFAHELSLALSETQIEKVIVTSIGGQLPAIQGFFVDQYLRHIAHQVPDYYFPHSIGFQEVLQLGHKSSFTAVKVLPEDLAFIQYTGGTTGIAKGVMLSHSNLMSNLFQVRSWIENDLQEGQEVIITALPLYHIFSLLVNCFLFVDMGGENVLIPNPRDIADLVKVMKKSHYTCFSGVNTLFNALLHHQPFCEMDHSRVKLTIGGGMAVQKAVADEWQKVTGHVLIQGYGLTETSPVVTITPFDAPRFSGSIGLPILDTKITIKDPQGDDLPLNTIGELCVQGPQVMQGYYQRPHETDAVLYEGWLHTGDAAYIDEAGFCYIVDRLKDMIIVSGFNVYPAEVENMLKIIPKINEVAVIGIPDLDHGEVVKAFVVKEKNAVLTSKEVIDFAHKNLAAYKCPHEVEFVEALPKSTVGKILKKELRAIQRNAFS